MSTTIEAVSVLNSAVRTVLGLVIVGGLGFGGWYGYNVYNEKDVEAHRVTKQLAEANSALTRAQDEIVEKARSLKLKNVEIEKKTVQITTLNVKVDQQEEKIARLDTSMRLLKVDNRVAVLRVLDQSINAANEMYSLIEFQEFDENDEPLGEAREFRIKGDIVYIDSWVVKFEDKYIEKADLQRGTSLLLFRRLFGEFQEPQQGFVLDTVGQRPAAYARGSVLSDFEKRIWDDFWSVANDKEKQVELGIRAIHGEAPFRKVMRGKTYRIQRRASGGLDFDIVPTLPRVNPPT